MKKSLLLTVCVLAGMLLAMSPVCEARDKDNWFKVDELATIGKGDAKEVKVDQKITKARITCTEGSVIINGFVVRHHGKADYHKIAQRLEKDQKVEVPMGDDGQEVQVDGFRISDDGKGKYKVEARKK